MNLIKNRLRLLFLVLSIMSFTLWLSACGGGGDGGGGNPQPDTNETLLTSGTWKVNSVTVDGVDKDNLFTGLTLHFSSGAYTAANGGPVWPASGTWSFDGDNEQTFTRGDGIQVTIRAISSSELTLSLVWDSATLAGGREQSIKGQYVFQMSK